MTRRIEAEQVIVFGRTQSRVTAKLRDLPRFADEEQVISGVKHGVRARRPERLSVAFDLCEEDVLEVPELRVAHRSSDERLAATQFSAYMGATNLCEAWSVRVAGRMIEARGYGATFALLEAVGLAGLGLLAFARARGPVSHPREKRPPERFPGG
jgi:hypothetical protein